MAKPVTVTTTDATSAATYSSAVPINHYISVPNVTVDVTKTGTVNYDLQYTVSDVSGGFTGAVWKSDSGWTGKTADALIKVTFPVTGLRIIQNSGSGSTSAIILQSGIKD